MMGKQSLSYAEQAAQERKRARSNRIISNVMFVAAAAFVISGIVLMIVTGKPTSVITVTSGVIIAFTAASLRSTAALNLDNAKRFDRLAHKRF